MPVRKRRQKSISVSNFAILWVVFKRHGSEGVKQVKQRQKQQRRADPLGGREERGVVGSVAVVVAIAAAAAS